MLWRNCTGRSGFCRKLSGIGGTRLELKKRIAQLSARIAAMQIPIYAGNASFFLLLSVFPIVSLLLSLLPYTPLTLAHLLGLCAQLAPDWLLRLLEYFIRTLYGSSSAAIISASAVLTLWSASKGMLSLLYGLNAVLEVRETRRYLHRRLLCVVYTVGMLLALLLTLGLYVGGQALLAFLDARGFSLAAVLEPVLRNLHLYSLVLPGAAGAACAWVVYSEIYSWYVNHIAKASALYGSLSVLLLMLLWLYACISILFYGALLNHALFDWKKPKENPECSDT